MKKSVILSAILMGTLAYNAAHAQVSVSIGFNLPVRRVVVAPPPPPPPVEVGYDDVYDDSDDYYYLPEVEAYWSISLNRYFYNDGGNWVSATYLPGAYRNFDWHTARRFEVRGRRPYFNHDVYRSRWGGNPNRGNWNRGQVYAGRGNDGYNRGNWGQPSRGGFNLPGRGGYNQPGRDDNRGNWGNQPSRGNYGYGQPNRNDDNRGGWGRGQGQPSRGSENQGGGRGGWGNGGGQPQQQPSQPSSQGGGRGGWGGGGRDRGNDNQSGGGRDRVMQGGGQIAQSQHRGGAFGGRF